MNNEFLKMINEIAVVFPAFVLILTFRGFFRALVARLMGDDTASSEGFLSLNPVVHIDVIGMVFILAFLIILGSILPGSFSRTVLLLMLIIFGVRWSHTAPIDENMFANRRRGMMLTAIAGPIGNFVLALVFLYVLKYIPFTNLFSKNVYEPLVNICVTTIDFSIFFGIFHMIPIPPFDGGTFLFSALPASYEHLKEKLEEHSLFVLLAVLFLFDIFLPIFGRIALFIKFGLLYLVF
jgi:Zn-dependent protease